MRILRMTSIFTLAMILLMASAVRAEKIANSNYDQWAKFKLGAFVKMDVDTVAGGNNIKSVMTTKLIELTADKVVVEITTTMEMMGQKIDTPAQKMEIPVRIEKPVEPAGVEKPKPATGEEDLKVGDKTIKTTWTETLTTSGSNAMLNKSWISPEIPGGVVKAISRTEGATPTAMTMTLVSYSNGE